MIPAGRMDRGAGGGRGSPAGGRGPGIEGEVDEQILVNCRRTGELYDVREHHDCPYCHGTLADVESGDHSRFCGFEPGKDPVSFGFPDDSTRTQRS